MAGVARFEVQLIGDKEAVRRIREIEGAERKLTRAFKDGRITAEQLKRSTQQLASAKNQLRNRLQTTSRQLKASTTSARGLNTALSSMKTLVGGVGAAFLAWKVKDIIVGTFATFAEFEKKMNRVAALTGAVGDEFEALQNKAESLGRTTIFTANQVADAMGFLAQAGLDTNEILGSLTDTLNLAAAAQLDMATAGDIVTNIMAGFGLETSELNGAVDTLTVAFTSANTDLQQLAQGMKLAGPIAKAFGFTFKETAAVLALMGNAGFQASLGGTSLRNAIIRIAKDGEKFNVFLKDAEGNTRAFVDILDELAREVPEAGDQIELLGVRGGPGLQALLGQGTDAIRELIEAMDRLEGITERIKEKQIKGLAGDITKLNSAVAGLQIEIGKSNSAIAASTRGLTSWINSITDSEKIAREFSEELPELSRQLALMNIPISNQEKAWRTLNARMMKLKRDFPAGIITPDPAKVKEAEAAAKLIADAFREDAKAQQEAAQSLKDFERAIVLLTGTPLEKLQQKFEDNIAKLEDMRDKLGNTTKAQAVFAAGVAALTANLAEQTKGLDANNKEFEKRSRALAKRGPRGTPSLLRPGEKEAIKEQVQLVKELEQTITRMELNQLDGIARVIAERDIEIESLNRLIEKHKDNAELIALLEKNKVLVNADANAQIEAAAQESFDRQAATIENFLQQVFTTARSVGDVIRQLFAQVLRVITSFIARTVAQWIAGTRQMKGASQGLLGGGGGGGGGGLLGGLLDIFGVGGGGGRTPSVATSGAGGGSTGIFGGGTGLTGGLIGVGSLSGGGSAALTQAGATGTAGGGATAASVGATAGQIGAAFATAGGLALLNFGLESGSRTAGTIGGAVAGAGIGFTFGGPIGAVIGAGIGALIGFFGASARRRKQRIASAKILRQFELELQEIVQAFKNFQVDEGAAGEGIDSLLQQFGVAVKGQGGPGRQALPKGRAAANSAREQIATLQKERTGRGALSIFENLPEFQSGASNIGAQGDRLLAILHRGESVLNASATRMIGASNIDALNRGERTPGGTVVFTEGSIQVVGVGNPKETADALIAEINRRARNKGIGRVV